MKIMYYLRRWYLKNQDIYKRVNILLIKRKQHICVVVTQIKNKNQIK
jgi:hypothetical protein